MLNGKMTLLKNFDMNCLGYEPGVRGVVTWSAIFGTMLFVGAVLVIVALAMANCNKATRIRGMVNGRDRRHEQI